MGVSVVAKSSGKVSHLSSLNFSVSRPAGAPNGKLATLKVSAHAAFDGSDYTIATPDGWTHVVDATCLLAGQGRRRVYLFRRFLAEGDASWTIAGAGVACPRVWEITVYDGVNASNPIKASATQVSNSNTTSHTAAGATTTSDGDWIEIVWTTMATSPNSIPGSMTHQHSSTKGGDGAGGNFGSANLGVATEEIPTAGPTGTRTLISSISITYASVTIVIGVGNVAQSVSGVGDGEVGVRSGVPFLSVPTLLSEGEQALDQESADLTLIVDADPIDPVNETVSSKLFSDGDPDLATNEDYDPVIAAHFSIRRSIFREGIIGGGSLPSTGSLLMLNELDPKTGAYRLDALLQLAWDDRPLHARLVGRNRFGIRIPLASAVTLQKCRSRSISMDGTSGRTEIATSDLSLRFSRKVQTLVFDPTAEPGIDAEMKGQKPPIVVGRPGHVRPKLVNRANGTYCFHRDPAGGLCRSLDQVAIGRNPISPDDYTVDLASGLFTLETAVDDALEVTCVPVGPAAAGDTVADNIRYLVVNLLGLDLALEVNDSRLRSFAAVYPGQSGWFVGEADETFLDVLNSMVMPGGYWTVDELGRVEAFLWTDPFLEPADYAIEECDVAALKILTSPPPFQSIALGYAKNWAETTQIAEAARFTPAGQVASLPHLVASRSDESIKVVWPNAPIQDEIACALRDQVDAEEEVDRLWTMYSKRWQPLQIVVGPIAARWKLGRIVNLTHSRPQGCATGANFRIAAVESAGARSFAVTLWRVLSHPALLLESGEVLLMETGEYLRV